MHHSNIIQKIVSYLPQRSIYECLRVNKTWQYAVEDQLYESIHFYNDNSVFMFYQLMTNVKLNVQSISQVKKPIITLTLSGKLKTSLVQHIHIHFQIGDNIHTLLFCLKNACPNVKSVTFYDDNIHPIIHHHQDPFLHPLLPQWRLITHFPSWSGDAMELWMNMVAHQITHLSLQLNNDHYVLDQQLQLQQKKTINYNNNNNNNNNNNSSSKNKLLNDGFKLPSFSFSKNIHFKSDYILKSKYHIMQIIFPLDTFHQLKVLQLDLGPISTSFINIKPSSSSSISSSSWQYPLFSQSTFDNLHSSCPLLQTLELRNFNMYTWYPNENKNESSFSLWKSMQKTKACTHLLSLQLDNVLFYHPLSFVYLSTKYPYLKSLKLNIRDLQTLENDYQHHQHHNEFYNSDNYKQSLYLLMTQSPFLTTLHVQFITNRFGSQWKTSYLNTIATYWPNMEMLTWLESYPKRLKDIHFPCSEIYEVDYHQSTYTSPNKYLMKTTIRGKAQPSIKTTTSPTTTTAILSRRLYLSNLTSLTLTFIRESPTYLLEKYLKTPSVTSSINNNNNNNNNNKNGLLQNLKSLKVINCDDNHSYITTTYTSFPPQQYEIESTFNIYIWLDAIPNLQILDIHGMNIIETTPFGTYHSTSPSLQPDQMPQKKNYQLKELILSKSKMNLKYNFNRLFDSCPSLTKLHCKEIDYYLIPVSTLLSTNPSIFGDQYNRHQDFNERDHYHQQIHPNPSSFTSDCIPYSYSYMKCLWCSAKHSLPYKSPMKLIIPNHYLHDIQFKNVKLIDKISSFGKIVETPLKDIIVMKHSDIKHHHRQTLFNYHKTNMIIVCQGFNTIKLDDRWIHY